MRHKLRQDLFRTTGREFIEAKLEERAERHKRQGGQRYVLEPNVKEGKGGLRDLQTLYWIASICMAWPRRRNWWRRGVLTGERNMKSSRGPRISSGPCAVICITSGRGPGDQKLTFDMQVEVAARMGYRDGRAAGGRAFHAGLFPSRHPHVGEVTARVPDRAGGAPCQARGAGCWGFKRRRKTPVGYRATSWCRAGLIRPTRKAFLQDKLNLCCASSRRRCGRAYLIHPNVMRLVTANLTLIDDDMREDPEAVRIFLDLMLKHGNPERALRRMNELGVLAAFIPEFEPIVAMMQFNVYHHYTVDEHIIQTISMPCPDRAGRVGRGAAALFLGILKAGVSRKVLYVALLLHDIGKGRPEDHSILGAQIARRVCPRLGLDERGIRNGGMAGALSPSHVRHGAEARYRRSAHGAGLCQGGEDAQTAWTC